MSTHRHTRWTLGFAPKNHKAKVKKDYGPYTHVIKRIKQRYGYTVNVRDIRKMEKMIWYGEATCEVTKSRSTAWKITWESTHMYVVWSRQYHRIVTVLTPKMVEEGYDEQDLGPWYDKLKVKGIPGRKTMTYNGGNKY